MTDASSAPSALYTPPSDEEIKELIKRTCVPGIAISVPQWLKALELVPDCIRTDSNITVGKDRGFKKVNLFTKYSRGEPGPPWLRIGGKEMHPVGDGFQVKTFTCFSIDHGCSELKSGKCATYRKYVEGYKLPNHKRYISVEVKPATDLFDLLSFLDRKCERDWMALGGGLGYEPMLRAVVKTNDGVTSTRYFWKLFIEFDDCHIKWSSDDDELIRAKDAIQQEMADENKKSERERINARKYREDKAKQRKFTMYQVDGKQWNGPNPVKLGGEILDVRPYVSDIVYTKSDNTKEPFEWFGDVEFAEIATARAPAYTVKSYIRVMYVHPPKQHSSFIDSTEAAGATDWSGWNPSARTAAAAPSAPPRVLSSTEADAAAEALDGLTGDDLDADAEYHDPHHNQQQSDASGDDSTDPLPIASQKHKKRAHEEVAIEVAPPSCATGDSGVEPPPAKKTLVAPENVDDAEETPAAQPEEVATDA